MRAIVGLIGSIMVAALVLCGLSDAALAQTAPAEPAKLDTGATAWMLVATALVLMMAIPGLALFYAGQVRKKNVLSTMMQTFATVSLVSLLWILVGYTLAFSDGNRFVGDLSKILLAGVGKDSLSGVIPEAVFVLFQLTFAAITPALICGAFADRMKFSALLWFMGVWVLLVYAPVAHWVWAPTGFLFTDGVMDFAGGTVVHINSGVAGLVACLVIGKRAGMGQENFAPHNLVLTMIGASLLWVGWFGFNAGSALAADGRAGMAFATTHVATAVAALAWMTVEWLARGKPSVLGIASGAVAGLVAITPACGFVGFGGAIFIGAAAGCICYWGVTGLKRMFGYDDALDVFGVHGLGGITGALLTGVFALEAIGGTAGLLEGNGKQMLVQLKSIVIVAAYSGVASFVILKVIELTIGLRVAPEIERDGLDFALHGETVH
jgi:ammonium transporter, Amt family